MASSTASNYLNTKQMDFLLKGTAWSAPTTIYVALFTTVPNLDGTGGVEVSSTGTAYKRIGIAQGTGWTNAVGANLTYSNVDILSFETPTANWGTIRGIGLFDAETDGNLLYTGYLVTPKTVSGTDNAPRILANQLRISRATC